MCLNMIISKVGSTISHSWTLSTDQLVNPLPHPPPINSVTVVSIPDSTTGCFPLAVHSLLRVGFLHLFLVIHAGINLRKCCVHH